MGNTNNICNFCNNNTKELEGKLSLNLSTEDNYDNGIDVFSFYLLIMDNIFF